MKTFILCSRILLFSVLFFITQGCKGLSETDSESEKNLVSQLEKDLKERGTEWDASIFKTVSELYELKSERIQSAEFLDSLISAMLKLIDTSKLNYNQFSDDIWSSAISDTMSVSIIKKMTRIYEEDEFETAILKRHDLYQNKQVFMLINNKNIAEKDSVFRLIFTPVISESAAFQYLLSEINALKSLGEAYFLEQQNSKTQLLVTLSAGLLDENSDWLDRRKGRIVYDLLKKIDNNLVVNELVNAVYKPDIRLRALYLGVKLGLPSTEDKLIYVLLTFGDKSMAEDFLNCGSERLYEGGREWGEINGYYIQSGMGSNRVGWGQF